MLHDRSFCTDYECDLAGPGICVAKPERWRLGTNEINDVAKNPRNDLSQTLLNYGN